MEDRSAPAPHRRRLLAKFTGVALIGFACSAVILHLGLEAGLRPWAARLVALLFAMHVTFLINGRFVFRALTRQHFFAQWAAYAANSAVGNLCNFWVFVTLESTHRPVIGNPYVALLAGSITAWAINFTGARFVVFGNAARRLKRFAAKWRFVHRQKERDSQNQERPSGSSEPPSAAAEQARRTFVSSPSRPRVPASGEPGSFLR